MHTRLFHKIFTTIFFVSISTFSIVQSYDEIINLGGDCQVAYQLSINDLRNYALPFDALITPHQALCGLLNNNFENFLTPDNFELVINAQDEKYILDKNYGTRWLHQCKLDADFLEDYEVIAIKYQRRIERFQDLVMNSHYPLFIRKNITKEQAAELRDILFVLRDGRPFLLVALDSLQEFESDWQLEFVANYYVRQPKPYSWKGDTQAWKEIFQALGLLLS